MQIKIGQIYKVKPEFRNVCLAFYRESNSVYVRYFKEKMEVLNENKQVSTIYSESYISSCFKPEHLEPLEKTLYNLEIDDEVMDNDGRKQKVLGLIESSPENPIYILSSEIDFLRAYSDIWTAYELKNRGFAVVQPEPEESTIKSEDITQDVKELLKKVSKEMKEMVEETGKDHIQGIINLKKAREYTYNQAIDDVLDLLKNN